MREIECTLRTYEVYIKKYMVNGIALNTRWHHRVSSRLGGYVDGEPRHMLYMKGMNPVLDHYKTQGHFHGCTSGVVYLVAPAVE